MITKGRNSHAVIYFFFKKFPRLKQYYIIIQTCNLFDLLELDNIIFPQIITILVDNQY